MCGIIGYIGDKLAVPYLLEGLRDLEYRGYDSAGVAVIAENEIEVRKTEGRLSNLEKLIDCYPVKNSTIGIGHTRWATHGKANSQNAHPHLSERKSFAVVHNGIIENHAVLQKMLESEGYHFYGQTDTQIIPTLLERNYKGDVVKAISETVKMLDGSFALAILFCGDTENIYCTCRSSPLIIGVSKDGGHIASDETALLKHAKECVRLGKDEIAVVGKGIVSFFDENANPIKKAFKKVERSALDIQKNGFEHFMLKEIYEQPKAIRETVTPLVENGKTRIGEYLKESRIDIKNINKIYITACGSAYHTGLVGKYVIERLSQIPVECDIASEFRYRQPLIDESTLVIVISQSGETADSLAALRLAKNRHAKTLSIVNVPSSSIAEESDCVLYTRAGPEIAVATTKAYSAQLAVLYLLAVHFAFERETASKAELDALLNDIMLLPDLVEKTLTQNEDICKKYSESFVGLEHAYFIGRGLDFASASEAALKIKEISYIHCEAYAAGELKHGTISLIEKDTVVVAHACCKSIFPKTISNVMEVIARGAKVIIIACESDKNKVSDFESCIFVPDITEYFLPSLEAVVSQLLSYYTAKKLGNDIDKPRNLAKSVTVE
ncbi:MAG: glutamine--fructose-6-phosphate transaminase (isomerizing) [Acutalibacteraceae bacterium]